VSVPLCTVQLESGGLHHCELPSCLLPQRLMSQGGLWVTSWATLGWPPSKPATGAYRRETQGNSNPTTHLYAGRPAACCRIAHVHLCYRGSCCLYRHGLCVGCQTRPADSTRVVKQQPCSFKQLPHACCNQLSMPDYVHTGIGMPCQTCTCVAHMRIGCP